MPTGVNAGDVFCTSTSKTDAMPPAFATARCVKCGNPEALDKNGNPEPKVSHVRG